MLLVMACWILTMLSGLFWAWRWTGVLTALTVAAFLGTQAPMLAHWMGWLQLGALGLSPWLPAAQRIQHERLLKRLHADEARQMAQLSEAARALGSLQASMQGMETQITEITDVYRVTKDASRAVHVPELFSASLDTIPRLVSAKGLRLIDLAEERPRVLRAVRAPDGRMVPLPSASAGGGSAPQAQALRAVPGSGMVPVDTGQGDPLVEMERAIIERARASAQAASAAAGEFSCPVPEGVSRVSWVPLWSEQKPIGVLVAEELPEQELKTLSVIANQLALQLSRVHLYEAVEALAVTDALTGLFVRNYFLAHAQEELARSARHGLACTVFMADLDGFKQKNDTFGHLVGDVVLREVARLLQQNLREVDLIARFGGEEFILLLIETPIEHAMPIAERLRQLVELHQIHAYDEQLTQTITIGAAGFPGDAQTLDGLIERADQALYAGKRAGRNRVVRWSPEQSIVDSPWSIDAPGT
ncbi:MAG: sensor domain-containing diguanylate cyclase [Candidatus Omnitrophota bacterium]|nr:sensor domain-containing diguanylate cyclase [Candidatus Omnitrophota bacterium]